MCTGTPSFPMKNTAVAVAYDEGDNQGHGVHSRFKTVPARPSWSGYT